MPPKPKTDVEPRRNAFSEFVTAYWQGEKHAGRQITYQQARKEASSMWNGLQKKKEQ